MLEPRNLRHDWYGKNQERRSAFTDVPLSLTVETFLPPPATMIENHFSIRTLNARTRAGKAHGFSMIELLVSIATIAILCALLMPAWKMTKRGAQSTQCSARLKNWGQMIRLYSLDHNGFIAVRGEDGKEGWASSKGPYAPYISDVLQQVNIQLPKYRNCPAFPSEGKTVSYVMNYPSFNDGSSPLREKIPFATLASPSKLLLMTDGDSNGGSYLQGLEAFEPYVKRLSSSPFSRHAGGVNALFADGHIAKCHWEPKMPNDPDSFVAQKDVWLVIDPSSN